MYNVATVTEAMRGLVGFRAHHDANLAPIADDLDQSSSGLWLDKAHALITAKILDSVAVYLVPEQTEGDPEAGEGSPLSQLIRNTLDDSVGDVLSALRTRKLLRLEGKSLLPVTKLYEGEGAISDLITPADRFVGLELITNDAELALNLKSLGIQLTGPVTDFPIWAQKGDGNLVQVATITTTYAGRMQWVDFGVMLSGFDSYIVGYFESDLPSGVQAVRRSKIIGKLECGGCDPVNNTLYGRWSPYLRINAVRRDNEGDPFDTIATQNYGLNLAFSVGCDIGPILIAQQAQMAEAIRQQAVVRLLNELAFSTQITTIEQMVRQNALFALQNGEVAKLNTLLDALDIDFSGLSARCLPDTQAVGMVKRTTVFRR